MLNSNSALSFKLMFSHLRTAVLLLVFAFTSVAGQTWLGYCACADSLTLADTGVCLSCHEAAEDEDSGCPPCEDGDCLTTLSIPGTESLLVTEANYDYSPTCAGLSHFCLPPVESKPERWHGTTGRNRPPDLPGTASRVLFSTFLL